MWQAITYVTSSLTLISFIIAVAAWVYKNQILKTERIIKLAPEEKRAELIKRQLEFFDVNTKKLTKEQTYNVVIEQIRERAKRFRTIAVVVIIIACLAASISIFALWKENEDSEQKDNNHNSLSSSNNSNTDQINSSPFSRFGEPLPFDTGWIFIGYYDSEKDIYTEGPMAQIVFRPTNYSSENITKIGDILEIIKQRNVIIADYKTDGLRNQMTPPAYIKEEISDDDRTGIKLDEGRLVIVRDVEVSGIENRPSSIWCRIASCVRGSVQCQEAVNKLNQKPQ